MNAKLNKQNLKNQGFTLLQVMLIIAISAIIATIALDAEMPGHRPGFHLGRGAQAGNAVGADDRLRDARQGFYPAASARAGGRPRHVLRSRALGGSCLFALARYHQRRTAADPCLRRRQLPGRERPAQLLGLQLHRLLRAGAALPEDAVRERIQGHGEPVPCPWHRGHSRRRLQSHGGRERARPDPVVQGHRQRQLLPAAAGPEALLHQRYRHREYGEPLAPARAATGRGFSALLGNRDAGRRLPLRPRHHFGARAIWLR